MKRTKRGEYALRAPIDLATAREAGIVDGKRGKHGGFFGICPAFLA